MRIHDTKATQLITVPFSFPKRCLRSAFLTVTPTNRVTEGCIKKARLGNRGGICVSATNPTDKTTDSSAADVKSSSRVIVVAVDETKESAKALTWTIENFHKEGDTVHVLHVIPYVHQQVLTSTVYYTPPILDPEISEQLYDNAQEVVDEMFIPVLKKYNVEYKVDMVQEKGSETIGDAVCHASCDLGACAVVVAAHKKHWLQTWLMGSSSREIAGKAPIPVIVYHG